MLTPRYILLMTSNNFINIFYRSHILKKLSAKGNTSGHPAPHAKKYTILFPAQRFIMPTMKTDDEKSSAFTLPVRSIPAII